MSTITERLALIVDGHTDGAVSAVRRLSTEEKVAADRAELLSAKIADLNTRIAKSSVGGTNAQKAQLSRLNGEYRALNAGLSSTAPLATKAEKALARIGLGGIAPASTLSALGKAGGGLLAGAAVFGGFEFLKHGIDGYEQLASKIRAVQQASGASVPDASRLVAITETLGVDSSAAALGMFRLGKNIELTPQRLANYNIAVARTKTGNVDLVGTLDNVRAAYQAQTDPAKKAAIVYEAFGRAGTTMLPILNATKEQLRSIAAQAAKSGRIFNDKDLQRARELQIATHEMKNSFDSLSISAARNLAPALTGVANVLTTIGDTAHSKVGKTAFSIFEDTPAGLPLRAFGLFHSGGKSAAAKAQADLAKEQDAAAQKTLADAANATLAGAFDELTGPQNVAQAKQGLADARNTLATARAERDKALRDLASARTGTPAAGAAAIEAAHLRIVAAEANLRKALYIGGDARIASARSTLASDQSSLNKLRKQGGVDTNKLADATERLRVANLNVASAQRKAQAAQKAANDATGLNVREALARLTGQGKSQQGLANANVKLAAEGASTEVIAGLDKLNQQIPGTLVKVAKGINAGIVAQLNARQSALDAAQQEYADAASNPDVFRAAGKKAGNAYVQGFNAVLGNAIPTYPKAAPPTGRGKASPLGATLYGGIPGVQVTINGNVTTTAKNGRELAADLAKQARRSRLGTPVGASL